MAKTSTEKKTATGEFKKFQVDKCDLAELVGLSFDYNRKETCELRARFNQIRANNNDALTIDDLRRVVLWKNNRVLNVPDAVLKELNETMSKSDLRICSPEIKSLFKALVSCKGVGFPMASAILKFLRPDIIPIIDIHAYRVLFQENLPVSPLLGAKNFCSAFEKYFDVYIKYVNKVYEIKEKCGLDLVDVDEKLYSFDDKHNEHFKLDAKLWL